MTIAWGLAVPVIIFVAVVMPFWLALHYMTYWQRLRVQGLGADQVAVDKDELQRLRRVAGKLDERISALEQILDADFPDWRRK